jgi:hypothetical protein
VDRSGRAELVDVPAQTYSAVSVVPDGRRLALGVADVNDHVWIYDLGRKEGAGNRDPRTRLPFISNAFADGRATR